MPGVVPLDDLPDSLRGTVVPADDMPGADTSTSGGPIGPRRRNTSAQRERQRELGVARGQGEVLKGAVDIGVNSLLNAPNDVGNALINVGAAAIDPYASVVTKLLGRGPTNLEERARANPVFGRAPLMTEAGERGVEAVAEMIPEPVQRFLSENPLAGDIATVAGGAVGARASGLLPKGPVLNEFSRNVARNRGAAPYQQSPVADVAQRYTVVPDDVRQSANINPREGFTGTTRAKLGPDVAGAEIPAANIRIANQRATQDMGHNLLDANGRVDAGLLQNAIEAEAVPYKQVAQLPVPQANTLAERLRGAWQERGGSLKGDAVAESRLAPLMDPAQPALPTDELLRRWREINGYASKLGKEAGEGSAAAQIKAQDLRGISDAILDEIESRAQAVGANDLVADLRTARENIARLHTLDDALDSVGWVDPSKLAAMGERHVPLSGGLAEVAADAAAAPRSFTPLGKAIDRASSRESQYGREPKSWLRTNSLPFFGNMLARGGIESLNRDLRAGSGMLRQPEAKPSVPTVMPPNAGPPRPARPTPLLPAPPPRGPMIGGGAREPAPAIPGEFLDMGYTADVRAAGAAHPGAARESAALTPDPSLLRQAGPVGRFDLQHTPLVGEGWGGLGPDEGSISGLIGQWQEAGAAMRPRGGNALDDLAAETATLDDFLESIGARPAAPDLDAATPPVAPYTGDALSGRYDFNDLPDPDAPNYGPKLRMQDDPLAYGRGAERPSGGYAARPEDVFPWEQPLAVGETTPAVLGGRTAFADFMLENARQNPRIGEPPPLGPRFGPDDEFPGGAAPAAPVQPQGPAPGGGISDMLTLQRNVPEGVDPFTPRNRARSLAMFEQGTPEAAEGALYGPSQGVREFPRSDFVDVGDVEGLRRLVEGNPDMTVSDLLVLLRERPDRPQGVTFTRAPELAGTPREYHRFADDLTPQTPQDIGTLMMSMKPGQRLVQENGRYRIADAEVPAAQPAGAAPTGGLAKALSAFDEGDVSSIDQLADAVEALPDAPPEALAAVREYRRAQRLDFDEDAGRGADQYAERFEEAIRALAGQ